MKTWVRSWVPCGEITGMVVRHGEAYSISDRLTVWENGKAVYRPTVHYAYCPCNAAINSLHELEMRQFKLQEKQSAIFTDKYEDYISLGIEEWRKTSKEFEPICKKCKSRFLKENPTFVKIKLHSRGGKRANSGRKSIPKDKSTKLCNFRLKPEAVKMLYALKQETKQSKNKIVSDAIEKEYIEGRGGVFKLS